MALARVVLATGNAGKVAEMRRILLECACPTTLLGLVDVVRYPEPPETGATFAENALLKARACSDATGLPAIADDSGLTVDALNGMPGIFSARWSGRHGDDAANLGLVLGQLADVPDERRGAGFVCAAALVLPDDVRGDRPTEQVVGAEWRGTLVREPRGSHGFGYDPIFVPAGEQRTSAELAPAEKDARSHRGQAFRLLAALL
jgi:XTP/dITP diphosphohydrolase